MGCFTSVLYDDIVIDTRFGSPTRNSFHWQGYFLPFERPLCVSSMPDSVWEQCFRVRRMHEYVGDGGEVVGHDENARAVCLRLWYEWQLVGTARNAAATKVKDEIVGRVHNARGSTDSVQLHRHPASANANRASTQE